MSILDEVLIEPKASKREWSSFQTQIFEACRDTPSNILVQAVAGSGKTTTIVEATRHVEGSTLFLAFNKAIAEELRSRVSCDCKTLNALGHGVWRQTMPHSTLDAKKLDGILAKAPEEFRREHGYSVKRAVGLAKNCAFGIHSEATQVDFMELIDSYLDVPSESLDLVASAALSVFEQSLENLETFDFDDQLYIPLLKSWDYPPYTNLFVDECQDLSPIQHEMLRVMHNGGSRIIAVGDRHQAIYGFRGALHNSMDSLKRRFECLELPLSISYRCAKRIVAEAQMYSEHIQAHGDAAEGSVRYLGPDESDPEIFESTMILCRNNASLFRAILKHVRARKPCRVLSNFLESFTGFVKHFKCKTSRELSTKLNAWYEKERNAADTKGIAGKLAMLEDKRETLELFCREYSTVQEILDCLSCIASGTSGPTFATVHKAKGLEHERVYILRPDLMPAFYARSPEQIQQESNLTYVAITRAKQDLTWGERRC